MHPGKTIFQRVLRQIRHHHLIEPQTRVLVCVSGGADSVALLRLLHTMRNVLECELTVMHFNHQLRPEADQEAQFVENLAAELKLEYMLCTHPSLRQETSGIQAKARQWRQHCCEQLVQEGTVDRVALAHHADDQTETMLLKLLRGCHLSGLQGMKWFQPPTIRPLLQCPKAELLAYLKELGQPWLEDASNLSGKYTRNRVRNELIPLMNELANGSLSQRLAALHDQSLALQDWMHTSLETDEAQEKSTPRELALDLVRQQSAFLAQTLLFHYVKNLGVTEPSHERIQELHQKIRLNKENWRVEFPNKIQLEVKEGRLVPVSHSESPLTWEQNHITLVNNMPSQWSMTMVEGSNVTLENSEGVWIGLPELKRGDRVTLRCRRDGDRFHPHWRSSPLKLKDFLIDQKVPLSERNHWPLLEINGGIVWVYPSFTAKAPEHLPDRDSTRFIHLRRLP